MVVNNGKRGAAGIEETAGRNSYALTQRNQGFNRDLLQSEVGGDGGRCCTPATGRALETDVVPSQELCAPLEKMRHTVLGGRPTSRALFAETQLSKRQMTHVGHAAPPIRHRGHGSTWNVQGQMNAERSRLGRRRRVTAAQKRESMPSTGTSLNPERIPLREVSQNQKEHCQKQSCVSKSAHRPLVQERTNRLSNGRTSF